MADTHETHRERCDRSYAARNAILTALADVMPKHRAELAAGILNTILAEGVTYADFQSAQAAERNIRKAARALEGLS